MIAKKYKNILLTNCLLLILATLFGILFIFVNIDYVEASLFDKIMSLFTLVVPLTSVLATLGSKSIIKLALALNTLYLFFCSYEFLLGLKNLNIIGSSILLIWSIPFLINVKAFWSSR